MPAPAKHRYLIALGGNMRHPLFGAPVQVLAAALAVLEGLGASIEAVSPTISTAPMGPSQRRFANGAAVIAVDRSPPELLRILQAIEAQFGRDRRGQRWRARVLDLDIILWSGGAFASPQGSSDLTIPHAAFRERGFVLQPAAAIAGDWRDPISGLTVRQFAARLAKPRPA